MENSMRGPLNDHERNTAGMLRASEILALDNTLRAAIQTLRFYAADTVYQWGQIDDENPTGPIMEDGGKRAKDMLTFIDTNTPSTQVPEEK